MSSIQENCRKIYDMGIGAFEFSCELFYERHRSSIGMRKAILDLESPFIDQYKWKYKHKEDALFIFNLFSNNDSMDLLSKIFEEFACNGTDKNTLLEICKRYEIPEAIR